MPDVVFSFSLYCRSLEETEETAPFQSYLDGVYEVCLAIQDVVAGSNWKARIALYTDESVSKREKTLLLRKLRKIYINGEYSLIVDDHSYYGTWPGSMGGALARFKAFSDYSTADAVFSIDADLHQDTLWRRAFRDFLIGENLVLRAVLLDYYQNSAENKFCMCGGFMGLKKSILTLHGTYIGTESVKWLENSNGEYGTDQMYLGEIVWPLLKNSKVLSVQMVRWHPAVEMPTEWKGNDENIWENSQFSTLEML